jgi:hypothetical protein
METFGVQLIIKTKAIKFGLEFGFEKIWKLKGSTLQP